MPEFCAHLGYMFTEHDLQDRFALARENGLGWVEHPAPYAFGLSRFSQSCEAQNLRVAQVAAPNPPGHAKGLACIPDADAAFQQALDAGIDAARVLDCPFLHIMSGLCPDGTDREELSGLYVRRIRQASTQAGRQGVKILIEAINDEIVEGFFLNDAAFAIGLIDEIGHENLYLLFDTYHAHCRGHDPLRFFQKHKDRIGHIQVADAPGRHEPGSGVIDYAGFFAAVDASGYAGVIGGEYQPKTNTTDGIGWVTRYG